MVAPGEAIDDGRFIERLGAEVPRRAGAGSADGDRGAARHPGDGARGVRRDAPERTPAPGGEDDWNVAQAIGHASRRVPACASRPGSAAAGRFPADAPTVVPGIPARPTRTVPRSCAQIAQSQRLIERSARTVAGHETEPCPLVHPLVGRLRCGEWLLFAGVHDLMHLEQLHDLVGRTQPEGPPA